jgi:hypothetical protein
MNAQCFTPESLVRFFLARGSLSPDCLWVLLLTPRVQPTAPGRYLLIFLMVCLLEFPFYYAVLRENQKRLLTMVFSVIIFNLSTHPFIYFAVPRLVNHFGGQAYQSLFISELFAVAVESELLLLIQKKSRALCFGCAALANLTSWWVGVYFV